MYTQYQGALKSYNPSFSCSHASPPLMVTPLHMSTVSLLPSIHHNHRYTLHRVLYVHPLNYILNNSMCHTAVHSASASMHFEWKTFNTNNFRTIRAREICEHDARVLVNYEVLGSDMSTQHEVWLPMGHDNLPVIF